MVEGMPAAGAMSRELESSELESSGLDEVVDLSS